MLRAVGLVRVCSKSCGDCICSEVCSRSWLYQLIHSNTAARASAWVAKCDQSTSSRLRLAQNDSAIALSYESPTVPIDWVIPNRRHSLPVVVRGVLAAVVTVEHDTADPVSAAALTDGCFQGVGDELGAHVPGQ